MSKELEEGVYVQAGCLPRLIVSGHVVSFWTHIPTGTITSYDLEDVTFLNTIEKVASLSELAEAIVLLAESRKAEELPF